MIVTKINKRVRCELYPCKNTDCFALGSENRRQLNMIVCRDHLKQIVEQGAKLLDLAPETVTSGYVQVIEELPANAVHVLEPDFPSGIDDVFGQGSQENQSTESLEPQNDITEAKDSSEKEVEPKQEEVYKCKYCDATFPKTTEGKTALMTHSRNCPNKPKK